MSKLIVTMQKGREKMTVEDPDDNLCIAAVLSPRIKKRKKCQLVSGDLIFFLF